MTLSVFVRCIVHEDHAVCKRLGVTCFLFRYHTAVRNTGLVALSTPYIDAFGTGAIITASHTIYRGEPRHQHTTEDQVIGVLGADFPLSYFQKYVLKLLYIVIVCSIPRI